ncbi:MAG: hypothetical protein R3B47_09850 [Bacteroidia bacterium]
MGSKRFWKEMQPFVVSALVSGAAMMGLWLYFDKIYYYNIELYGNQNYFTYNIVPKIKMYWSVIFCVIPPLTFLGAIGFSLKENLTRRSLGLISLLSVVMWLLFLWLYIDFHFLIGSATFVLPGWHNLPPFTGPYLTHTVWLPFVFALSAPALKWALIKATGKKDQLPTDQDIVLSFVAIPMALLLVFKFTKDLDIVQQMYAMLRPFPVQIALSALIVMLWQLLFGWLMVKRKMEDGVFEKIEEIGEG